MTQSVTRDPQHAMLAGVCAGLAANYGYDVKPVRAIWIVVTIFTGGLAVIPYALAALLMPRPEPKYTGGTAAQPSPATAMASSGATSGMPMDAPGANQASTQDEKRGGARRVLWWVIWAFIALLITQVYLAGLFLMGGIDARGVHTGLGWSLTYYPFITLIVAAIARMPRRFWLSFAVMFIAVHIQPFLPSFSPGEASGWLRAVHPMNAVLLVILSYQQVRIASQPADARKRNGSR